MEKALQKL